MEKKTGPIQKMRTEARKASSPTDQPTAAGTKGPHPEVHYALPIGEQTVALNPLIGRKVRFRYTGRIFCVHCGKLTKTSFSQGYCYRCMQTLAQCDMCIVRPETCHHHLGTCREPAWGETHCMIEHTVYLANSSGIKVGITRTHQVKTRWMDQGAVQALPIVSVRTRRESGLVEATLSKIMPDKTNWRVMLQSSGSVLDLQAKRDELFSQWAADLPGQKLTDGEEHFFKYPVLAYPAKPSSLNLDKEPQAEGILQGIKGQYLILSTGVINMRKYGGYELEWESESLPELEMPVVREKASVQTSLF